MPKIISEPQDTLWYISHLNMEQVILMMLNFHRINIAKHCCPIYEVAMHLAPRMGITSLTAMLPLNRGDFDKIKNEEGGAW